MHIDKMTWGNHSLPFGNRTLVMGILNVTPDSFSDGGQFFSYDMALDQGNRLVEEGADILDIGGESTRPFSDPVPVEEEIRRVVPIIEHLTKHISIPISIDTTKAEVARKAIDAGAAIINDVSALRQDECMAEVAAAAGVPVILMHMKDAPGTMQVEPTYKDVVNDIRDFLNESINAAVAKGIDRDKIIIDPGIGFGKTVTHNLQLINRLKAFEKLGCPMMVGPSRKFFLRQLIKHEAEKDIPANQPSVETATQAAVSAAVLNGAHLVRVHDVESTRRTVTIIDAIKNAR